jgi:hypothetical protein
MDLLGFAVIFYPPAVTVFAFAVIGCRMTRKRRKLRSEEYGESHRSAHWFF